MNLLIAMSTIFCDVLDYCSEKIQVLNNVFPHELSIKMVLRTLTYDDFIDIIGERIIKFIDAHPNHAWNWELIGSINHYISANVIAKHPERAWPKPVPTQSEQSPVKNNNPCHCKCTEFDIGQLEEDAQHGVEWYRQTNVNWRNATRNLSIPLDFIETHPTLPWAWGFMANRNDLTLEFIRRNINKNWNWELLSAHPVITLDFVKSFSYQWSWSELSTNPNMTSDIIINNITLPWHWDVVKFDEPLLEAFIKTYTLPKEREYGLPRASVEWFNASINPSIMKFIEKHIDAPWNYVGLSANKNLTPAFIKKHLDKPWNWGSILQNSNIPMEFVEPYAPEMFWEFALTHPHLPMEFIAKHIDKEWDFDAMSHMIGNADAMLLCETIDQYFTNYLY